MSKFTAPQLKALKSAADTGNAWNAWGNVYRASTDRMMKALCAQGLLTHDGRPTEKTEGALGIPAAYGSVVVGSEVVSLADDEFYQCEIPGAPGRVTMGGVDITPKATGGFVDRAVSFIDKGRDVPVCVITGELSAGTDESACAVFLESCPRQISVGLHIQIIGRGLRFSPTIYYPMRNGIKKIVVKKKGVDLGPWA